MRVLLTNDDGIHAPGLAALHRAASRFSAMTVVAPDTHLSGCGHRVITDRPLLAKEVADGWHAIDGTPADCARLGVLHLATDAEWVLSGINDGGNLGVDIYMSGTVAAVREAVLLGKKGIAFSQFRRTRGDFDWSVPAALVEAVLEQLLPHPLPDGAFWNVNFPDLSGATMATPEIVICAMDRGHLPVRYLHENGLYHYQGVYQDRPRTPGSDVDVCFSGRIAVSQVPLFGFHGGN